MKKAREELLTAVTVFSGNWEYPGEAEQARDDIINHLDRAGYVILPKEPSEKMIEAANRVEMKSACEGDPIFDYPDALGIYSAMIDAAREG